jgi:hypothetical protein
MGCTHSLDVAREKTSLRKFITTMSANSLCCDGGVDAEKLVHLAVASDVVTVRQRLRPPWNPGRGQKRNNALGVGKGALPSPAALSKAILAGQEVFEFLQKQEVGGRRSNLRVKDIDLVQAELIQRYGSKAPWC